MASCLICHRLAWGFMTAKAQFCSKACQDAKPHYTMPYEAAAQAVSHIPQPNTREEAKAYVCAVLEAFQKECRNLAGLSTSDYAFHPWHNEKSYLDMVVAKANPKDLVRSIVDGFERECIDSEIPF